MICSKKHLSRKLTNIFAAVFLSAMFFGCKEKEIEEPYIVKVGSEELRESDLDNLLGSYQFEEKHRDEFIRQWIELQLLFNEAQEKQLNQSSEYENIIDQSKKEIAAGLLLTNFYSSRESEINENELKRFFDKNIDDFKLTDRAVVINFASFQDMKTAARFRRTVIDGGWQNIAGSFSRNPNLVSTESGSFYYFYQLPSSRTARTIENLLPGEISIVFESEPKVFTVVQLVNKLKEDDIPSLKYIRKNVEERYRLALNKHLYKEYIEDLYSKYNVEIKRETE